MGQHPGRWPVQVGDQEEAAPEVVAGLFLDHHQHPPLPGPGARPVGGLLHPLPGLLRRAAGAAHQMGLGQALAGQFKRKPTKSINQVLGALEVLGQAQRDGEMWRLA